MHGLFARPLFNGFGPCRLCPDEMFVLHQARARRGCPLRVQVRADCPRQPGVYGMVDGRGELIYVGKAKSLRGRLLGYFRPRSRDPKAGRILQHTRKVVWEVAPNEFAALLRELELIQRWQPRFNVHGQPFRRRRTYVCVGRPPAPYVFVTAKPPKKLSACFGPVPAGPRVRDAMRWLNDGYGLRDCPQSQPMIFSEEQELFPVTRAAGCLRYEIGTCVGPCTGTCSGANYSKRVKGVCAFLSGGRTRLLDKLQRDMTAAAAALAFERAALLRDRLETLGWLRDRLEHLRQARERLCFIYPVGSIWYLIRHGTVLAAVPKPSSDPNRQNAVETVRSMYAQRTAVGDFVPRGEIETVLLVAAWFRRYPAERDRVIYPDALGEWAS